jgi:hypothetical protein
MHTLDADVLFYVIRATAASCPPSASLSRPRPSPSRCVALALSPIPSCSPATTPLSSQANRPSGQKCFCQKSARGQGIHPPSPLHSATASCRCPPSFFVTSGSIIYFPRRVHHLLTLPPPPPHAPPATSSRSPHPLSRPHHFAGLHDGADQSPTACALPPPFLKLCFVPPLHRSLFFRCVYYALSTLAVFLFCSQKYICVASDNLSGGHFRLERGCAHWRQVVDVEVTA